MDEKIEDLLVERRDNLVWMTINRPSKANAMTVALMEAMRSSIVEASGDAEVKAVVITGSGERAFCAGVDIREQSNDEDPIRHRERRSMASAALQDSVMSSPKPIVVVLNGIASGAGAMLALIADSCVAVDTAQITLPEIDIGIASFSGASIVEVVGGRALAKDLIQTGRRMSSEEGLRWGIVSEISTRSELEEVATKVAEMLGSKKPAVFAENKAWMNRPLKAALSEAREEHARHRVKSAA